MMMRYIICTRDNIKVHFFACAFMCMCVYLECSARDGCHLWLGAQRKRAEKKLIIEGRQVWRGKGGVHDNMPEPKLISR